MADRPETVAGSQIEVRFDSQLCIHSRFCVLQAPAVFRANTPGEWIHPDEMAAHALAAVARNCPSGAISYRAKDASLDESDPPVNTIRLREDGPYAVSARIEITGQDQSAPMRRRTLCRCGASGNKPFCDGSHERIGFEASGEPPTGASSPLKQRGGPLAVTPLPDGPLEVQGAAEIVSGTGRMVRRTTHALLCRCGGSSSKPFCDGTHASNGFTDGPGVAVSPALTPASDCPSLAEWAGGREMLRALTVAFYDKVPQDAVLEPVFRGMDRKHAEHVADFLAEVFGGRAVYTDGGGSHVGMVVKHLGRAITEEQRARWVALMIETADEVGLPDDDAFRNAFENYLEWGSRLAVINSAPGVERPEEDWPMPRWGWGAAGGPSRDI